MSRPKSNFGNCTVGGCDSPSYCRTLCKTHYHRLWRTGSVLTGDLYYEFSQRFDMGADTECWVWTGSLFESGYGRFSRSNKKLRAHRVSYEIYKGAIPDGMHVLHECDNPPCVNPNHLFLGTHLDNMKDMERKGRAKWIQENLRAAQ